jgi:hypothetical protein
MSETATIPAKNWWSRFMQRLTDLGNALEVTDVDILTARVARLESVSGISRCGLAPIMSA